MSAARVSGGARHAAAASKHSSKPGMGTQVAAPCTDVDYLKMRDSMLHGLPSAGRNGTAAGAAAAAAISAPSNTSSPTKGHQATTNAVFAALASLASRNGTHGTMNAAKLMNVPGAAAAALANGLATNTGGLAAAAAAASAAAAKPTSSAVGSKRAAPTTSEVNSGRGAGGATKKSKRNAATSPTSSARGNSGSGTRVSAGVPRMDVDMGSDSDEEDWEQAMGGDGRGGNEDPDRARMRREKNRVAARKCRAKKVQFMARMQQELKDLTAQNNELKMQVVTWHRMFSREVKLRDAMKRLIQAVWGPTGAAAATGQSASDVLLGLEAGTLDVNTLIPAGGPPAPPPPPVGHAGTAPALPAPPPPPPDVALLDPSLSRLPSLLLEGPLDPSFPPGSATSTTVGLDPMMFGMMGQPGHPPYPPMPGIAPSGYPGSTSNLPHPNMLAPPPPPVGGTMQDALAASMGGLTSIAAPTPVSIDLQPPTAVSGPVTTPSAFAAASAAATAAAAAAAVVAGPPGLPARPSVHQPGEGLPMPGGLPCSPIGIPPLAEQSSLRAGAMSPTGSQHDGRHPHAPKRMRPSFNSAASSPFAAASGMPTSDIAHPHSAVAAASAAAAADAAAREISFAGGTATTAAAAAALNSSAMALPGPTPLHGTSGLTQLSSSGILRMPTAQLGLGLDLGSAASASMELGTFLTSLTRNSTPPPGLTGPTHMHAPRAPTPLRLQQLGGDDAAGHAGASAHASGMGAGDSVVLPAAQLLHTGPASLSEDATLGVRPAGYSSVARVSGGLLMPKPDPSSLTGGSLSSTHSEGTGADLAKVTSLGLAQAGLGVLQAADSLNMLRADTLPGAGALLPPASPLVVQGTSSGSAVAKLESRELSLLAGGKAVSGELLMASLNTGVSLPGSGMPGMQRNLSLDWLAMALDYSGRQSPGMGPAAAPVPAGMTAAAAAARPAGAVSPAPGAPTAVAHKSGSSSPLPAAQGVGA